MNYTILLREMQMCPLWIKYFLCRICDKKFWTDEGLETHSLNCTPAPPRMTCPICDSTFEKKTIYSHMVSSHPTHFEDWLRAGRCFLCNNSAEKPFDLPAHWGAVHNMKLVTCLTTKGRQRIFIPCNDQILMVILPSLSLLLLHSKCYCGHLCIVLCFRIELQQCPGIKRWMNSEHWSRTSWRKMIASTKFFFPRRRT